MSNLKTDTRILVECRRLGTGGPGRATEYLLRGLAELQPPGQWLLWGGEIALDYLWPGATWAPMRTAPGYLAGQAEVLSMPAHDVAVYMHQSRPLHPGRSVTLIHDTIGHRFGGSFAHRLARRSFHWLGAKLSSRVITVSEYAKDSICRELPVAPEAVRIVQYPIDMDLVHRVDALRARLPVAQRALYVGQFARHKNLERLMVSFGRTKFAREGGGLLLVGGDKDAELERLQGLAQSFRHQQITVEGVVSQERLDELYATSRLLVMPSIEEGYGLPAWEALTIGLPLCASYGGALPEVTRGLAVLFDPMSIEEMARCIDLSLAMPPVRIEEGPTVADFASGFLKSVDEALGD